MSFTKKTIRDGDFASKTVLVRVDYNVPFSEQGGIVDDTRLRASVPTLRYLLDRGARLVLISHLGRPQGEFVSKYSLKRVLAPLAKLLEQRVEFFPDCIGREVISNIEDLSPNSVILLENLRFYPGEEKNDPKFAFELSRLGDIFVFDAFGAAHRAHASVVGVTKFLPTFSGLLLEKEVSTLSSLLQTPKSPFILIMGGAKIADKIAFLKNIIPKIDVMLVGGGMANTFLKSQGVMVGKSLVDDEALQEARVVFELAKEEGVEVVLPEDVVVTESGDIDDTPVEKSVEALGPTDAIFDIGSRTVSRFSRYLKKASTILWNGTVGVTEHKAFANASFELASLLKNLKALRVVGGGDTAGAVTMFGCADAMDHVSTGGGATLEFLEGRILPGVASLPDRENL